MFLDQAFGQWVSALTGITFQQSFDAQSKVLPRGLFYTTDDTTTTLCTGPTKAHQITVMTVEIIDVDIDSAQSISQSLRTTINGFRGLLGGIWIAAAFVEQASDDYVSKALLQTDENLNVALFHVRIFS